MSNGEVGCLSLSSNMLFSVARLHRMHTPNMHARPTHTRTPDGPQGQHGIQVPFVMQLQRIEMNQAGARGRISQGRHRTSLWQARRPLLLSNSCSEPARRGCLACVCSHVRTWFRCPPWAPL
jgi:hypothetical protein